MSTATTAGGVSSGWLSRERTIAKPGFNRWMVPPAALCVHLCIGQVYAFSVFNKPMSLLIGGDQPAPADWSIPALGWIFSIAIVFLGLAAAFGGAWVEKVGPRKTMATAALLFGGGFVVAGFGITTHQLWLVYLGYGVLGGCGLGLGYISPVKTLMTWFPDRPGMATGMAIMGFGGGAFIASPLSVFLMNQVGVAGAFFVLGLVYFIYMMVGATIVRTPAKGWAPKGYVAPTKSKGLVTSANVHVDEALKTKQFWLLWGVLCLNVTAGIGVLGQASLMSQEMFPGVITAAAAAGFVGLLSLFNMLGRFFWASTSDYIGRKTTYMIFFALGIALYAAVPFAGQIGCALRSLLRGDPVHVWRRLCHHPRLSEGCLRHPLCGGDPWPSSHRLVGRWRPWAGARQLHSRVSDRLGCAEGRGLYGDHVHHGRSSGGWTRPQSDDDPGRREASSAGRAGYGLNDQRENHTDGTERDHDQCQFDQALSRLGVRRRAARLGRRHDSDQGDGSLCRMTRGSAGVARSRPARSFGL